MIGCEETAHTVGKVLLFIGNEAHNWSLQQFEQAAQFARQHNVDTLIVKVFDGPNERYGGVFGPIYQAIKAQGVNVLPFGYLYGYAKGSDLNTELDLVVKYMKTYGMCCGDIEGEWNGQVAWAQQLNSHLASLPQLFFASVFANPSEQAQNDVLRAIAPSVNAWMPQVYNDHHEGAWRREFHSLGLTCLQPTYDLSNEFGPNNVVQLVKNAVNEVPCVSLWEYQSAQAQPALLDQLVQTVKGASSAVTPTGVPAGWTYDSTSETLRANGYEVIKGFRQWILTHSWDPRNVPLENEHQVDQLEVSNPSLGRGSQQAFCWTVLEWAEKDNQVFEMRTGQELLALRKEQDNLAQQVQSLKQQLAALTGNPPSGSA